MPEEMMENRIDGFNQYRLLKNIVMLNIKSEISLKDFAKKLNIDRTHPYFYKVLALLIDNEIVVHVRTIGTLKFIKINNKELVNYIYDSEFFDEEFVAFVKFVNPLYNI